MDVRSGSAGSRHQLGYVQQVATITDIQPQRRRQSRVSVFLDGEFWTGMPQDVCALLHLKIGEEIDDQRKGEVEREVGESAALESALHLLSYRARSEKDLRKRLLDKDFNEAVVDAAMARVKEYGYVNDSDYSREVIESHQLTGKGRRTTLWKLRSDGVDPDEAQQLIEEAYPEENEVEVALAWASRRRVDLSDIKGRQRLTRQLLGRGFNYDVIRDVISQLREGADDD